MMKSFRLHVEQLRAVTWALPDAGTPRSAAWVARQRQT